MILSQATDQLRVLLVEDYPGAVEQYKHKLELDDYDVAVAAGDSALLVAREAPPDLIFLTVQVPSLDTALVLEALRLHERTRDIPVVILTDYDQVELLRHGFVLGALDHLINTSSLPGDSRRQPAGGGLQVLPGSEPAGGSSLMSGFFSGEAFEA